MKLFKRKIIGMVLCLTVCLSVFALMSTTASADVWKWTSDTLVPTEVTGSDDINTPV